MPFEEKKENRNRFPLQKGFHVGACPYAIYNLIKKRQKKNICFAVWDKKQIHDVELVDLAVKVL